MAVTCELDNSFEPETTVLIPEDVIPNDVMIAAVGTTGVAVGDIEVDAAWLLFQAQGNNATFGARFFVGVVPDPVPASVTFSRTGSNRWAVVAKFLRGALGVVEDIEHVQDFADPAQLSIALPSVTASTNNSYLVYCLVASPADNTTFETGPTPDSVVSEQQLGRVTGTTPITEAGIWAGPMNAGASGAYTQTIDPAGAEPAVNGMAVLMVIPPGML